jgi:amino acid transporter
MDNRQFYVRKASGIVRNISAWDALAANIVWDGQMWAFIYIIGASVLFPGVDLPITPLIVFPLIILQIIPFYFLAISMPRAGGDYIWVSRTLHPIFGFSWNFLFAMMQISFIGIISGWVLDPGLRSVLLIWGTLTNNPGLVVWVGSFLSPLNLFIMSSILAVIAGIINFLPTKFTTRTLIAIFIISTSTAFVYAGLMLGVGHAGFIQNFNRISGANYDAIIKAAQSAGYNTGFTMFATILGLMYAFQALTGGYTYSIFLAGEIKSPGRSQAISLFGAPVIVTVITYMLYQVTWTVVGSQFVKGASFLAATGNSAWTLPMLPYLNYLTVFTTNNPILAILPGIGLMLAAYGTVISIVAMVTRMFFAYSFDRIIPTAISSVENRFHVPRNAVALVTVIAIFYAFMFYYTPVLTYYAYGSIGMWLPQIFVGIAAIIFPYRRKDIFEKAPKIVQTKVGGVPVITILGFYVIVCSAFNTIIPIVPVYTGAAVNPIYVLAILLTMLPAPIIYGIAYWYNNRRGLDMGVAFRELPPA